MGAGAGTVVEDVVVTSVCLCLCVCVCLSGIHSPSNQVGWEWGELLSQWKTGVLLSGKGGMDASQ